MLQRLETAIPDWLWSPENHWSRFKGYGRMFIFLGLLLLLAGIDRAYQLSIVGGIAFYGVGLLGMRMELERKRKQGAAECRR